jgi:hypothetical protein
MDKLSFTDIKELISEAREVAKVEGQESNSCLRSRGAWLRAEKGNEVLNDSEVNYITTLKSLKSDVAQYKALGADTFTIEGGFDGADSIKALNESDYCPWVSEWEIILDVNNIK